MIDKLIAEYKDKFLTEVETDENKDYRRGFYAGRFAALLELKASRQDTNLKE